MTTKKTEEPDQPVAMGSPQEKTAQTDGTQEMPEKVDQNLTFEQKAYREAEEQKERDREFSKGATRQR
jgi:hypothetical protein